MPYLHLRHGPIPTHALLLSLLFRLPAVILLNSPAPAGISALPLQYGKSAQTLKQASPSVEKAPPFAVILIPSQRAGPTFRSVRSQKREAGEPAEKESQTPVPLKRPAGTFRSFWQGAGGQLFPLMLD